LAGMAGGASSLLAAQAEAEGATVEGWASVVASGSDLAAGVGWGLAAAAVAQRAAG